MNIEQMKEIEALKGGVLRQSELDALGFIRNSDEPLHGVYELYHKKVRPNIEVEVNFILGSGEMTVFGFEDGGYLTYPLLFKSGEQLKHFVESFTD